MEYVRWNPWRTLRARPHLELHWAYLSGCLGCIEQLEGGRRRITIDARLGRRQRSATCGHEVIHDELDLLWPPDAPEHLVEKGEHLVERLNAERSVPLGALAAFVAQRVGADLQVTAYDVAEEFDVTEELAALALTLLRVQTT